MSSIFPTFAQSANLQNHRTVLKPDKEILVLRTALPKFLLFVRFEAFENPILVALATICGLYLINLSGTFVLEKR